MILIYLNSVSQQYNVQLGKIRMTWTCIGFKIGEILEDLVDFRRFSKEPSTIGEKLGDFSISLVFGKFFAS